MVSWKEQVIRAAIAKRSGWISMGGIQEDRHQLAAALRITVRGCMNYPRLRRRDFRLSLHWAGTQKDSEIWTMDTWGCVRAVWEEGQAKNAHAPVPHLYDRTGQLCLGLELEVQPFARGTPNVGRYFDDLLIPYLCLAGSCGDRERIEGYDRPHNIMKGYLDWFAEQLNVRPEQVPEVMKRTEKVDEGGKCLCGSGLKWVECHQVVTEVLQERHREAKKPRDWQEELPFEWVTGKTDSGGHVTAEDGKV